jgi:hypothetical protein
MVGFMVTFLLPEGATQETAGMYVAEAIQQYRGCLRPPDPYGDNPADTGDPMFHLDPDNVRVQAMRIQS